MDTQEHPAGMTDASVIHATMNFEDREDTAREFGQGAVAAMEKYGVAPTPSNYRIWYNFLAGQDPDLVRSINEMLDQNATFTPERNRQIFAQFFESGNAFDDLFAKSTDLESLTTRILSHLEQASSDQKSYVGQMNKVSGEIAELSGADGLAEMIKKVLVETKKIVEKSQQLKESLDKSSVEVTSLKSDLEEAREEALTDALTGIGNRKFLDMRLRKEVSSADESGEPLCVVLADIDRFKNFNDKYGHAIGDQVLKLAASVLKDSVKGQDTPTRYGGEEFCIVLPRTVLTNAAKLADNLRATLAERALSNKRTGETYGRITMSLGIAMYRSGESIENLVNRVDQALYSAKNNGRNRVECEQPIDSE